MYKKGFSTTALILSIAGVVAAGGVGYYGYKTIQSKNTAPSSVAKSASSNFKNCGTVSGSDSPTSGIHPEDFSGFACMAGAMTQCSPASLTLGKDENAIIITVDGEKGDSCQVKMYIPQENDGPQTRICNAPVDSLAQEFIASHKLNKNTPNESMADWFFVWEMFIADNTSNNFIYIGEPYTCSVLNGTQSGISIKDFFSHTLDLTPELLDRMSQIRSDAEANSSYTYIVTDYSMYPPIDPFSQFDRPFDRVQPGVKVFYTSTPEQYLSQLKPSEVLIHLPSLDSKTDGSAYAIDTLTHVLYIEQYRNQNDWWTYDEASYNAEYPNDTVDQYNEHLISHEYTALNLLVTFQEHAYDYTSSSNLMTYVNTLPQNTDGSNIKLIYDKTQELMRENNVVATDYDSMTSMQCGVGVCRNGATYLTEALTANGVDTSVVFSQGHEWVRVNNDGTGASYDLDPNAYQSFVKVPLRTVDPIQVIHVNNIPIVP